MKNIQVVELNALNVAVGKQTDESHTRIQIIFRTVYPSAESNETYSFYLNIG